MKDTSILSTEEEEMAAFFWRCAKSRQCKGAVTTKENEIISSRSDEHNHHKNEAEIVVSTVSEHSGHILHE